MSETKKSLIDIILEGKEEIIKGFKAPFIKAANKRAALSARDNINLQINEKKMKIQSLYEDAAGYPNNIQRILELKKDIRNLEAAVGDLADSYEEYFGKKLPREMDVE